VKTFLLSVLAARVAASGKPLETFHPYAWLVWEPGAWHAPRRDPGTVILNTARKLGPVAGEALAMVLDLPPQGPGEVVLGRAETCDLVVNDATLSSRHLALTHRGPQVELRDVGSRNGTYVDGVRLTAGHPVALREGARIEAADVRFTFHTPDGMRERLRRVLAAVR
jgi:hypothetical protein